MSSLAIWPSSNARSSLTRLMGRGGWNASSSCLWGMFHSSIEGRLQSINIWSSVRSLLASSMLWRTQQQCTTVGRKFSFMEDLVPISLNLAFKIPKPRSTLIFVEGCFWLNQASSLDRGTPIGPILKGVMHQLSSGYPRSATM